MHSGGPTRRAVVAGALATAVVGTAGCNPPAKPKPDEVIRQRVLAGKRALLERYTATLQRYPELRGRLSPLLADHQAHLQALNGSLSPSPGAAGSTPPAPAVPGTTRAALTALAAAEQAAADGRIADVLGASPRLARVLAAIGGCEAGHAELLRSGGAV